MPKAEFGTTKWMSNKIKASGLQKLRWYCQMCEKQCRDENGFKCHRMSEGHQRMMQIFIQNPNKFMDDFSVEFEREFMRLMKTRYCRTRVLANSVYNHIVADRQHIHMNSTIWVTLSEFVQYLGSTNKCKIELTPKGWYIEYIDHEELRKLEEERKRRRVELSQEEAKEKHIAQLVEEAKKRGGFKESEYTPLLRKEGEEKIVLKGLSSATRTGATSVGEGKERGGSSSHGGPQPNALKLLEKELREKRRKAELSKERSLRREDEEEEEDARSRDRYDNEIDQRRKRGRDSFDRSLSSQKSQRPRMAAERLRLEMEESKARSSSFLRPSSWTRKDSEEEDGTQEERRSERGERSQEKRRSEGLSSRRSDHGEREDVEGEEGDDDLRPPKHKYAEKDWWLSAGCIVKVMHETLGDGRYFRQKGRILRVEQRYAGYVRMLETGDLIRLDQQMLETVIPNFGGPVRVVLGEWRDHEGQLEGLDEAQYCVHVILTSGPIFKARPNLVPFVVKGLPYEHVCKIMDEEKS